MVASRCRKSLLPWLSQCMFCQLISHNVWCFYAVNDGSGEGKGKIYVIDDWEGV